METNQVLNVALDQLELENLIANLKVLLEYKSDFKPSITPQYNAALNTPKIILIDDAIVIKIWKKPEVDNG